MKPYYFPAIFLLFLIVACNKKENSQPLPPELRQEFNCYINEEYWERKQTGGFCNSIDFKYYKNAPGGGPSDYLAIGGKDCLTDNAIGIVLDSITSPKEITRVRDITGAAWNYVSKYEFPYYEFDSLLDINLTIAVLQPQKYRDAVFPDGTPYVDVTNGWIEGTFEMTLMNDLQDTVRITDGKFAAILY